MNKSTVIALDLAKNVIQVTQISAHGEIQYNKAQSPNKVREILAKSKACIVAMEGCGSAQYWSRFAQQYGHEVRMMSPRKVKPFVTGQKNDVNDAIGIAVAAIQPNMTFAPVKSIQQQSIQSINTVRRFLDKNTTALSNQLRAICYEYGQTMPKGAKGLRERMAELLSPSDVSLPEAIKSLLHVLYEQYQQTRRKLNEVNELLDSFTKELEPVQRLQQIEGVGVKSASLLYAAIGNGTVFKNGRSAAVYAGVTPMQYSSGGKSVLLGITKQGDSALRSTMYQGALSVISHLKSEASTSKQQWLLDLVKRIGVKRACIALVNKNIRTAWAMLKYKTDYQPTYL